MTFAQHVERFELWRSQLAQRIEATVLVLQEQGLSDPQLDRVAMQLHEQIAEQRYVVAVVGLFSKGKTELLNALLAADGSQLLLPTGPGRTTQCSLEISYVPGENGVLRLLPVETKQSPWTLERWNAEASAWHTLTFDVNDSEASRLAMHSTNEVKRLPLDEALVLGFGDVAMTTESTLGTGWIEVPRWRHARLSLDLPMLRLGVVLLDTPGLDNAGLEQDLSEGVLQQADLLLLVLDAEAGLTHFEQDSWLRTLRPLCHGHRSALVALNKFDLVRRREPPSSPEQAQAQALRELHQTKIAQQMNLDPRRVIAVCARQAPKPQALADTEDEFERLSNTLGQQYLLSNRDRVLAQSLVDGHTFFQQATRALRAHQHQLDEQIQTLESLEAKNRQLLRKLRWNQSQEFAHLEQGQDGLNKLGHDLQSTLDELFGKLGPAHLRTTTQTLIGAIQDPARHRDKIQNLYHHTFDLLVGNLDRADESIKDIFRLLQERSQHLHLDQRFVLPTAPDLQSYKQQLRQTELSHIKHITGLLRDTDTRSTLEKQLGFILQSRLESLFDHLLADIEEWGKQGVDMMQSRLVVGRHHYARQTENISKVQQALGELTQKLLDLRQRQLEFDGFIEQLMEFQNHSWPSTPPHSPST